ncbi:MAG: GDP-mannose 4,6-dehydratase, partial [Alphaproteobacteria bacterium]|nr:GDP-mannose 4,6-dehydratase [Alphaproteobacteria bacterium]
MDKAVFLVTGGAGFIGSHFVDEAIKHGHQVIVLDKLTYAGNRDNLSMAEKTGNLTFIEGDICDARLVKKLLVDYQIDAVFHLAAESHVDNSIAGADI